MIEETDMDELQSLWRAETGHKEADTAEMDKTGMLRIIRARVKRERNTVGRYLIGAWVWQMLIYSSLTHFIVRFWGDWFSVSCLVAGILLYVPFTVKWARYSSSSLKGVFAAMAAESTVRNRLNEERAHLAKFFSFKKRFDWVGIPLVSFLIVLIFSALSVIPVLSDNPLPGIAIGLGWCLLSFLAVRNENRKHFEDPLRRLQAIIDDMENAT